MIRKGVALLLLTICTCLYAQKSWDSMHDKVSAAIEQRCKDNLTEMQMEQISMIICDIKDPKVTPSLILGIISTESNWHPKAVGAAGSIGLMQLQFSTAKFMGLKKFSQLKDPIENLRTGIAYVKHLFYAEHMDTVEQVISSYRIGPSRGRHNPKWNKWYVDRVIKHMKEYQAEGIP